MLFGVTFNPTAIRIQESLSLLFGKYLLNCVTVTHFPGLIEVLELLEKCWNLKCLFKDTGNSLKMRFFPLQLIKLLETYECSLFTSCKALTNAKISKRNTQKKFEEDRTCKLMECQKMSGFRYFGFTACLVFGT